MASIYTYPAPVYIEGPNASLVGLDALARAGTQFMAGQQAAKGDAFKQQSAMADMMAKQAQAAKYAAETQLLNRQYNEGNRLGETLSGLSRMNQGQSPFPTPAETGEMFRKTRQQQEGLGGEVLARFLRSYEMKNPEQAAGALGQFQNMRLQNEGAGLARQAGLPNLGLAAFMAQTAAGKPSDPYVQNAAGQVLSPFTGVTAQTPLSQSEIGKNNRGPAEGGTMVGVPSELKNTLTVPMFDEDGAPMMNYRSGEAAIDPVKTRERQEAFAMFRNRYQMKDPYQALDAFKLFEQINPAAGREVLRQTVQGLLAARVPRPVIEQMLRDAGVQE